MPDPRKPTPDEVAALEPRYKEVLDEMAKNPRITGVDIGYVYVDRRRTDDIAVRIHVRSKKDQAHSFAAHADALKDAFVIEAEYVRGSPAMIQNIPPEPFLQPGISISNEGTEGGTLGLIVSDNTTGNDLLLSAAHVLGLKTNPQQWVIQPAKYLGGTKHDPTHRVGHVTNSIDDIDGDAAVASNESARPVKREQVRTGVLVKSADAAAIGDKVEKDGMGTTIRCGFVDGIGQYRLRGPTETPMKGFRIARGNPGDNCTDDLTTQSDSGCLWYRKNDKKGLGLHVGGDISVADDRFRPAIACHLEAVLKRLDVKI